MLVTSPTNPEVFVQDGADKAVDVRTAQLATYACRVLALLDDRAPAEEFDQAATDARARGTAPEEADRARRLGLSVRAALDRSERREACLVALVDTGRELALQEDLDELLRLAVRRARLIFRVDMAYVSLVEDDRTAIAVRAADGHSTPFSSRAPLALTEHNRAVFLSPHPICSSDYLADERAVRDPQMDAFVRAEGLRAMMAVPLRSGGEVLGTLHAAHRRVRHFTPDERAMMAALGELAAAAVERARRADRTAAAIAGLERSLGAVRSELRAAERAAEVGQRLLDVVLGAGTLHELAAEADRAADAAVAVCAAAGEPLAASASLSPEERAAMAAAAERAATADGPVDAGGGIWAAPVLAGGTRLGTVLVGPRDPAGDPDRRLLGMLARTAAMLLRAGTGRDSDADRARAELLRDLLTGARRPGRPVERRVRQQGLDLDRPHVVAVAGTEEAGRPGTADRAGAYARRAGGLAADHDGTTVLLLPGADPSAVARAVRAELGGAVTVGAAGPVSGPAGVPAGHQEAGRCLRALSALGATGRAASARELGFLGVLLSDRHDVRGFVDAALGPLLEHDRDRRTELIGTLDAYYETGGSPLYAAERLHVHPNTVARRLDRIRELLPDFKEPDRALDLQLALRLLRVRDAL